LACALVSGSSWGDDSNQVTAEAAFAEGVKLMKDGRCSEAVDRFRASQELDPASGTLLDLAYCEVRLGHLVSAWLAYRRAISLAREQGKPTHERVAREQAEKLEAELPRLSLRLAEGVEEPLAVDLDGKKIPPQTWSVAVPLDPGPHELLVLFSGGRTLRRDFNVAEGQRASIDISSPEPPSVQGAAPSPAVNVPPAHGDAAASARRPVWALALGSSGIVALLGSVALFGVARSQYDSAARACNGKNQCPSQAYTAERDAIGRAKLAAGIAAGAAIVTGGGAFFYFYARADGRPSASPGPATVVTAVGDWTLGLRGAW
jgi:hypothetical protein